MSLSIRSETFLRLSRPSVPIIGRIKGRSDNRSPFEHDSCVRIWHDCITSILCAPRAHHMNRQGNLSYIMCVTIEIARLAYALILKSIFNYTDRALEIYRVQNSPWLGMTTLTALLGRPGLTHNGARKNSTSASGGVGLGLSSNPPRPDPYSSLYKI